MVSIPIHHELEWFCYICNCNFYDYCFMKNQTLNVRLTIVASYELDEQGLIPKGAKEDLELLQKLLVHFFFKLFGCPNLDKPEYEEESPVDSMNPKGSATFTIFINVSDVLWLTGLCKIADGMADLSRGLLTIQVVPELLSSTNG